MKVEGEVRLREEEEEEEQEMRRKGGGVTVQYQSYRNACIAGT